MWHRAVETPIIIFENVVGFDTTLLSQWLGDLYHVIVQIIDPEDVGWTCCRRPRVYAALVHKTKVELTCSPKALFAMVSNALRPQGMGLRVRDLLVASADEVASELVNVLRMRGLRLRSPALGLPTDMTAALTDSELMRLKAYDDLWRARSWQMLGSVQDLVMHLGDNPEAGFVNWSVPRDDRGSFKLPTFRKDWKIMWCPSRRRWLTVGERAVAMGFPAYPSLQALTGMREPVAVSWAERGLPGNSMHVACVGVWQACVAASCRHADCTSLS